VKAKSTRKLHHFLDHFSSDKPLEPEQQNARRLEFVQIGGRLLDRLAEF
jgi:hypothetical protein